MPPANASATDPVGASTAGSDSAGSPSVDLGAGGQAPRTPQAPTLDGTADAADRDTATVRPDGSRIERTIADVVTNSPVNHVDHRGRVFEVFNPADSRFWREPVVYCYSFSVRRGQTKGWGLHRFKDDRYTLLTGEVVTVLHDARVDSPTHGATQEVTLTPQGVRQLLIPRGVWHLNINVGETEAHLINHPTQVYDHIRPDRMLLPWDSDVLDYDVAARFPNQFKAGTTIRI